jgi:hypothetical protein
VTCGWRRHWSRFATVDRQAEIYAIGLVACAEWMPISISIDIEMLAWSTAGLIDADGPAVAGTIIA